MEKINANKMWSKYYEGLIELIELKDQKEEKDNNSFGGCHWNLINIEKLILFIEVLEDNIKIKNIESLYQGTMLFLGYSFLGEVELLNLIKSEPLSKLFKKIISYGKNAKFPCKYIDPNI